MQMDFDYKCLFLYRMLLFSVNIQAGHLPSPSTSHTQPLGCNESDTSMSTVPRKFLSERVNYCNQEDDEDRIDMNGVPYRAVCSKI